MTDLRQALHGFLQSKTDLPVINAMKQFTEPNEYVSYYILSDDTESISIGNREYNEIDDKIDKSYSPMTLATVQLDIRGDSSFQKSRDLFFGVQTWQDDFKNVGLFYRGVGGISPIPNIQNGYVKEGYQLNLFLGYDSTIINQIDYATSLILNKG